MSDIRDWKALVDCAIVKTCIELIKEPLLYFSEADIQQRLVELLRNEELKNNRPFNDLYPTKVLTGPEAVPYETYLIHREYGGGEGTRVDVVIFHPSDVEEIDDSNLQRNGEYLDPLFAIELGTEKSSANKRDTEMHLRNDLTKVRRSKGRDGVQGIGYIIHFYRDTTREPRKTGRGKKTDKKIQENFQGVFKDVDNKLTSSQNIKIVAILRRVAKKGVRITNKAEIFVRRTCTISVRGKDKRLESGEWHPVNIRDEKGWKRVIEEQLK
jgi:hypothetical protein